MQETISPKQVFDEEKSMHVPSIVQSNGMPLLIVFCLVFNCFVCDNFERHFFDIKVGYLFHWEAQVSTRTPDVTFDEEKVLLSSRPSTIKRYSFAAQRHLVSHCTLGRRPDV